MSEPEQCAAAGEPIDHGAKDAAYLRLVESLVCEEWFSADDAQAYDDL